MGDTSMVQALDPLVLASQAYICIYSDVFLCCYSKITQRNQSPLGPKESRRARFNQGRWWTSEPSYYIGCFGLFSRLVV
jgi:hypothetical protein